MPQYNFFYNKKANFITENRFFMLPIPLPDSKYQMGIIKINKLNAFSLLIKIMGGVNLFKPE